MLPFVRKFLILIFQLLTAKIFDAWLRWFVAIQGIVQLTFLNVFCSWCLHIIAKDSSFQFFVLCVEKALMNVFRRQATEKPSTQLPGSLEETSVFSRGWYCPEHSQGVTGQKQVLDTAWESSRAGSSEWVAKSALPPHCVFLSTWKTMVCW